MSMMRWTPEQLAAHQARQAKMRTGIAERNAAPPKKRTEHDEQADFFTWARKQRIPGIELLHAVPNGGLRTKAQAGKLKAEGVQPGMPDVSWPVARGGFIGLAIEFKANDGTPTKEQRDRIDALQREGWCVAVCWTWHGAARMLQGYATMLRSEPIELKPEEPAQPRYIRNDVGGWEYDDRIQQLTVRFSDGLRVTTTVEPGMEREAALQRAVDKANQATVQ